MANSNLYKSFDPEARFWLTNLGNYNEGPFKKKHPQLKQSACDAYQQLLGECYSYVESISLCDRQVNGDKKIGKKSFSGRIAFTLGKLKKKNKKQQFEVFDLPDLMSAKDAVYKLMKDVEGIDKPLDEIKGKVKHEDYGFLSAAEWYKLLIMTLKSNKKVVKSINQMFT